MQSLNNMVNQGKVLYLGVSDTPAWIVSKCNEYARQNGMRQFSVYQGRWSAEHRDFERDIIPMCREEGMGLAPWGALGGGKFKTDEQRKSQEGRKMGEASEAAIKISKVLEKLANKHKTQLTSVALAYVMQKTPYVFPIVGGRKIDHLKGNIEGLSLDLSSEDIKEIDEANAFDIGFPHNFLGGANGVQQPEDVWLMGMAGSQQHVKWQTVSSNDFRVGTCANVLHSPLNLLRTEKGSAAVACDIDRIINWKVIYEMIRHISSQVYGNIESVMWQCCMR